MNPSNQLKLDNIFAKVFDNPTLKIEPHMTANDVEGWDSMSHMQLIVAVEKEFGIKISGADVMRMKNVGDLIQLIDNKILPNN